MTDPSRLNDTAMFDAFFAPIAALFARADVTECVINKPYEAALETRAGWEWFTVPELDYKWLRKLCDLMAGVTRQDVDTEHPLVSTVLPGGARVQCLVPPAVPDGTVSITIRKGSDESWSLDEFEARGLFDDTRVAETGLSCEDQRLAGLRDQGRWPDFFRLAVETRKNILISGATGSGKTSFAKGLVRLIPAHERLLTIEDTRELVVPHRNVVHMTFSKDGQSLQKIGIKQLLEAALRMRPDRILLQELRDGAAFFYLRNVNSGHPGSITTVHGNSAQAALEQLTLLVKEAPGGADLHRDDIRGMLRALVDIVVQMRRVPPRGDAPAQYRMTEVLFRPEERRAG